MREEIIKIIERNKELERCTSICFNIYDEEKIINEILALAPFEKLERVREYAAGLKKQLRAIKFEELSERQRGILQTAEGVLSVLDQQEGEFDVSNFLMHNENFAFQREYQGVDIFNYHDNDKSLCILVDNTSLDKDADRMLTVCDYEDYSDILYRGKVPKSKHFFLTLLRNLGIDIENQQSPKESGPAIVNGIPADEINLGEGKECF